MDYINVFINTLIGGLAGWLSATIRSLKAAAKEEDERKKKEYESLRAGMRVLMSAQLHRYYLMYREADSIPNDVWNEIDHVYSVYHDLGGNSSGTKMYEFLKTKPLDTNNIYD